MLYPGILHLKTAVSCKLKWLKALACHIIPMLPLYTMQHEDEKLSSIFAYLEEGKSPENESLTRGLTAEKSLYEVVDSILHYVISEAYGQLRMAVPRKLIQDSHMAAFRVTFPNRRFMWPFVRSIGGQAYVLM